MTTLHEAARLALEALETHVPHYIKERGYAPIETLRSALAQQPELSTASKSEQLLASQEHALRAEFQRMKAALAQQVEQQPVDRVAVMQAIVDRDTGHRRAAPAAQPDLSALSPKAQERVREWIADGTFVERAIGVISEQERELMAYEKAAGAAAEREECAKVLDEMAEEAEQDMEPSGVIAYYRSKAAAIRARGNHV